MAVEYETTPSTPGNTNPATPMFPLAASAVKKRVLKHTSQENFRASLFFCGKRKRSHRDRYYDYEHHRLHSSSVPRQREFYTPKSSYLEYKNRNRGTYAKPERILPLNKAIVSKIEKISQDSNNASTSIGFINRTDEEKRILSGFSFNKTCLPNTSGQLPEIQAFKPQLNSQLPVVQPKSTSVAETSTTAPKLTQKSGSFESPFNTHDVASTYVSQPIVPNTVVSTKSKSSSKEGSRKGHHHSLHHQKQKESRRNKLKMQIQFDDPNGMDCGNLNDFLSSSSLSSSDSEAGETNESDREGDDELTDWPGNEAMVNFTSKNDFKRANKPAPRTNGINSLSATGKPIIYGRYLNDDNMGQDEDTLMSADELTVSPKTSQFLPITNASLNSINLQQNSHLPPASLTLPLKFTPALTTTTTVAAEDQLRSMPISITAQTQPSFGSNLQQIESEMSGETSNHFLSSMEVREIRAGCRRIRDERPGFTIFTSVNEHLSR